MARKFLAPALLAALAIASAVTAAAAVGDSAATPAVRTFFKTVKPTPKPTIAAIVAGSKDFTLLLMALKATNLVNTFADASASFTVFAPTDAAFVSLAQALGFTGTDKAKAYAAIVAALTKLGGGNPIPLLTTILKFHVTTGRVSAAALIKAGSYMPLEGMVVKLAADKKTLIDYAPSVADPMLVKTDIMASNGIIHAINGVLLPIPIAAATPMPSAMVVMPAPMPATMTIAQIAVATPELSLLVKALTAAGLVETVSDAKAMLTVFAPTNSAFLALARTLGYTGMANADMAFAFVVSALTKLGGGDPVPMLRMILLYHVLPKKAVAATIVGKGPLTTVQGSQVKVLNNLEIVDLAPAVANAKIIKADIMASNGVVHLINRVLLPIPICPAAAAAFCSARSAVLDSKNCRCIRRVRVVKYVGHGRRVVYRKH
eukprot:TRINITY_DN2166_c0_g1_i1.p2 TRINITY_DN2166_c0_g1~~TRINITY_DN2166_c0_g1_i1.p2  ORF type:complete len:475 (-),score=196.01 TRINITY_DN2166_c0_g1_i1:369-1664(-)